MRFASYNLRDDRCVVLAALEQDCGYLEVSGNMFDAFTHALSLTWILQFASDKMKSDDFILTKATSHYRQSDEFEW